MTSVETGSNGWMDCTALRLVQAVHACPSGVFRMSDEMPDLVESSIISPSYGRERKGCDP